MIVLPVQARSWGFRLVMIAPFIAAMGLFLVLPSALMDGDSPCYLAWCPKRTSVYPLFLRLAEGRLLLGVQLALLAGSIAWFASQFQVRTDSLLLTAGVTFAVLANPYLWQLQASVMSEALTVPMLIVLTGCVLAYCSGGRPAYIVGASFLAGLSAATRPSCLPLIIGPILAVWWSRHATRKARIAVLCILAWLAPLVGDHIVKRAVHGPEGTSLIGLHTFGKAAVIEAPKLATDQMSSIDRKLVSILENHYAPARAAIRSADDSNVRRVLLLSYEVCFQYACMQEATADIPLGAADLNKALLRTGLARLKENPIGYLQLTATEFTGLWLLHPRKSPDLAPELNSFLRASQPLPFQNHLGEEGQPVPQGEQKELYRYTRAVFLAVGVLFIVGWAALSLVAIVGGGGPLLAAAAATANAVMATQVLTSILGVGIPRYTMGLWPAIVFVLVATVYLVAMPHRHSKTSRTSRVGNGCTEQHPSPSLAR